MLGDKVIIERIEGVTLYGYVIAKGNKLGNFGVYSDVLGNNGQTYVLLKDAQIRMRALIGVAKK